MRSGVGGKRVITLLYLLEKAKKELVLVVEGEDPEENREDGDSQGPHIALPAVVPLLEYLAQHFGSHKVVGTLTTPQPLPLALQLDSPSEIDKFDVHLVIQEDVLRFEVSMDDIVGVNWVGSGVR